MSKITADKITVPDTSTVTADKIKLDPVVEINNLALVLLNKIEKLGSTPDLTRASSHIRLAADIINQTTKK